MNIQDTRARAQEISKAGSFENALSAKTIAGKVDLTLSEGVVLGLLRQDVRKFLVIFGHGSTDIGNILRIYKEEGAVEIFQCRNEVAMAHAATALSWIYGEIPAVVTSIGPGALQAFAGSLAAASNGIGVYYIFGDETTHGEGINMQQIPGQRQNQFGRLTEIMGNSYTLHTPEALRDAMRHGNNAVYRSNFASPFFLCLPINTQPKVIKEFRLDSLPKRLPKQVVAPADDNCFIDAIALLKKHGKVVIKAGGGTRHQPDLLKSFAESINAPVALSPGSVGVLPDRHPLNMHVGGSKGTISGNYAMENAELVIVMGARAVCQSDCSGTGYLNAKAVININGDIESAAHYNNTVMLCGDIGVIIVRLLEVFKNHRRPEEIEQQAEGWVSSCCKRKSMWQELKSVRCSEQMLYDVAWKQHVLTQPSAIKTADRFTKKINGIRIFDAGDVQANGFQIIEVDHPDQSITESGSSYMGFAVSSLLSNAIADEPRYMVAFTGDGSFMMNPQILVDAVVHGVKAMIIIFDNRRMAAISSLQTDQYNKDFATNDGTQIDYVAMANAFTGVRGFFGGFTFQALEAALEEAHNHKGLSVVHVPVYWGDDPLRDMGAYGRWNVGPWCEDVERLYTEQTI